MRKLTVEWLVGPANHSNYWDGVMKGKKRMEHERFREGYVAGVSSPFPIALLSSFLSPSLLFTDLCSLFFLPLSLRLVSSLAFPQWSDSLHFLTSPHNAASGSASEIPVAGGQWKVRRREEHVQQRGGGEFVWEWGE